MAQLTLRSMPLESPRGKPLFRPVRLAPRLKSLRGKHLLLLDNSQVKPEAFSYGAFFDRLEQDLLQQGAGKVTRFFHNLLRENLESVKGLAPRIRETGADAVVFAMCHAGVTTPSVTLAVHLERAGIPTAVICTSLGYGVGIITAQSYAPGLPLIQARPTRNVPQQEAASAAQHLLDSVTFALTAPVQELRRRAEQALAERAGISLDQDLPRVAVRRETPKLRRAVTVETDPSGLDEQLYDYCCRHAMGDGLPVIAPTKQRVQAMLRYTDLAPDDVLVPECPPSGAAFTVRSVAVNAVMAGCRPEYFPIVVTAVQAMAEPKFRLLQAAITTHPSGNMVLVSGPLAKELGIQSGAGCLGPGFRANATIGRALTLCLLNIARSIPGLSDLSTFGSPAEYTFCFAESDEDNPWEPLHTELFDPKTTCVMVDKCEGPHNAIDNMGKSPEQLLDVIASKAATVGGNNATNPSDLVVLLNPGIARLLAEAGYTKKDVRAYLFDKARNPASAFRDSPRSQWPRWFHAVERVPVVLRPEDIHIVVCGGVGPHSMVCVPWGFSRAVTKSVVTRAGRPVRSVAELARRRRAG